MGVTKLWNIVEDAGKPVRLETLRKKRLAIDASIWIYQFLKAVRNKEGQALRGSHIVGFFRRICKLLYHGVLPVFVFDGGAPVIKLNTIAKRRERREGQRQSAAGTAQKLLMMKLQKEAEKHLAGKSDESIIKRAKESPSKDVTIFKKEDDYHLPEIDKFYHKKSDKRFVSPEDYRKYMESLDDDIAEFDLNNIDPASDEFNELSLEKQYRILHKLRLRSRLRMGYSKEQLQNIFPNSLDFSKFQIEMVTKRNFLTQRLLNVVGLDDSLPDIETVSSSTKRMAGESDKAYTLHRNKDGWSLSLDNEGLESSNPIKLDSDLSANPSPKKRRIAKPHDNDDDDDDEDFSDMEWEDVKIESKKPRKNFSLNALPLPPASEQLIADLSKGAFFTLNSVKPTEEFPEPEDVEQALFDSAVQESTADQEKAYQEELVKAIEASKKELQQLQKEQENFLEDDVFEFGGQKIEEKNNVPIMKAPKLSLGKSFFSKKDVEEDNKDSIKESKAGSKEGKEDVEENKKELGKKDAKSNELPSWFGTQETFDNVYSKQSTENMPSVAESTAGDELIENFHYSEEKDKFVNGKDKFDQNDDQQVVEVSNNDMQVIELNDEETDRENADLLIEVVEGPQEIKNKFKKNGEVKSGKKKTMNESFIDEEKKTIDGKNLASDEETKIFDQGQITVDEEKPVVEGSTTTFKEQLSDKLLLDESKSTEVHAQTDENEITNENKPSKENRDKSPANIKNTQNKIIYYDFDEEEEKEIANDFEKEEQAHAEFVQDLRKQYQPAYQPSGFNYNETNLREQQKRELRDSDEVTDVMIEEVKDLLTCFGIPYITAPMEAEAQCAQLLILELVDGIATDDSDCFLFGGDKIYRHLFTEKKFAEFYEAADLDKKLGLTRERLIELAYLLGSDYTEGLKGIGPVIAMKIINEFGDLTLFRDWCVACQENNDQNSEALKKLCNNSFRRSLRKRLVNNEIFLDRRFPDPNVRNSYLNPEIDPDATKFVWGAPDLDMLRNYLGTKIGWSREKINQILVPLIRRYNSPW